jgi:hypothetical protein
VGGLIETEKTGRKSSLSENPQTFTSQSTVSCQYIISQSHLAIPVFARFNKKIKMALKSKTNTIMVAFEHYDGIIQRVVKILRL